MAYDPNGQQYPPPGQIPPALPDYPVGDPGYPTGGPAYPTSAPGYGADTGACSSQSAAPYQPSSYPGAYDQYPQAAPAYQQPVQPYQQSGYAPAGWGVDPVTGQPLSDKSKLAAGLFGIFLGAFGVGRFYTGHVGIAVGQIAVVWGVLFLFGCVGAVFIFPAMFCWAGALWPLIDGIVILAKGGTDAQGRTLRDS